MTEAELWGFLRQMDSRYREAVATLQEIARLPEGNPWAARYARSTLNHLGISW